jgi:cyclopropane fatty-acyl-phospholipid synthase-like methyltransferase
MPEHTLLDLGCGTLRGGIPIIRYLNNGNYTAVDVRQEVIHEARLELEESGLASKDPVLICIDNVSEMVLESSFDFIWAFSVLIHMEDNVLRGGLQFVRRHLKNQGRFFANVVLGNSHDGHWREFPLVEREASFYQEIFLANDLCMTDLGPLSEFGHTTKVRNDELNKRQHMMKATPVE